MKDPAFLFYPNDYIGGTMGMTFEEKGAYIELLMLQFNVGHMSDKLIHQLVGDIWSNVCHKFKKDDEGLWFNERLEYEQTRRNRYTESRKNNRCGITKDFRYTHESDMNKTCVYIIKDLDTNYIKIGASVNPKNRLSTIKSRQNKNNLQLLAVYEDCTLADEKHLHEVFDKFNTRGDWFAMDEGPVIEYISKHMSKHMSTHMSTHMSQHMENENEDINVIENKEEKEGAGRKGNKQPKREKTKYADFVNMTEIEHKKLIEQYGPDATARMINILDNYKGSKGKTYKDDYRAILSWVVDRYNEEQTKHHSNGKAAATSGHFSNSQGYQGQGGVTPRNEAERRTAERRDLKELSLAVLASDQPAEHHGGHQQQ